MGIKFACDIAIELMRGLSDAEPVFFQRNGSLFVASEQGFVQVTYGLHTRSRGKEWLGDRYANEWPEFTESVDAARCFTTDYDRKPVFIEGEKEYFEAMALDPDTPSFSLEDMVETARKMGELRDDGKIRIAYNVTSLHSHKHGYAADGVDVFLAEARVMDRERYLKILRQREQELLERIKRFGERAGGEDDARFDSDYSKLQLPDWVVVTPNMMLSFPRRGMLSSLPYERDNWDTKTRLTHNFSDRNDGSILRYLSPSVRDESPFSLGAVVNLRSISAGSEEEFKEQKRELDEDLEREFGVVSVLMPHIEEKLDELNALHNHACRYRIARNKEVMADL